MPWVIAQAILFALIIFLPLNSQFDLPSWLVLLTQALSGIGFAVLFWAIYDLRKSLAVSPDPIKNGQLQTNGIYSWIRHPMYLAVWLILGGGVVRSGSFIKIAIFAILVAFFVFKVRYEESQLKNKYPGYKDYIQKVGAFIPRLSQKS